MSSKHGAARVQKVIVCELEARGGKHGIMDPIRRIPQVYDLDGNLLFEFDSYNSFTFDQLLDFAAFYKETDDSNMELALSNWFNQTQRKA